MGKGQLVGAIEEDASEEAHSGERFDTLSVIVVTHNSERFLSSLAASLPEALASIANREIVVVDSGSTDGTVEAVRRLFPSAAVVELGSNAGYAAGVNRGIASTSFAGPILILNPDTRPERDSLLRLMRALDQQGTGIAVPRLVDASGATARSLRRRPTVLRSLGEAILGGTRAGRVALLGEVVQNPAAYEKPGVFDWATGAVMCTSRACLAVVGAWDESFFLYSEESDFALRARDAGFALRYVPESVVFHATSDGLTSPKLFALIAVNRVRCYRQRHGLPASVLFWFTVVLGVAVRATAGSVPHRAALKALFRPPKATIESARAPG